jgi:hypothetical protein
MNASPQPPNKRKFALLTVAFLLLAFAGVVMATGGSTVMAMVAVSTSLVCVRLINVHTPSGSATEAAQRAESSWATRLRRPIGIISIILVPIMAMASFFLYRDGRSRLSSNLDSIFFCWDGVYLCTMLVLSRRDVLWALNSLGCQLAEPSARSRKLIALDLPRTN